MRLLPVSDLHLERRRLKDIPKLPDDYDVLVCAGDIWEAEPEKGVQAIAAIAKGRPAVVVPGNHDLYAGGPDDRRTPADLVQLLRAEAERQNARAHHGLISILSGDAPVCVIGLVKFVGLTLWTDWLQASRWVAKQDHPAAAEMCAAEARSIAGYWRSGAREYEAIRTERGPWTPYTAVAEHAREKARLVDELTVGYIGITVVVTHHSPLGSSADVYRDRGLPWWTPAVYGSELLSTLPDVLCPNVWIHGHVHSALDHHYGRTRVVANPIEGGTFNPGLVVEV